MDALLVGFQSPDPGSTNRSQSHDFFVESKAFVADFRHRALRHHAEGIFMAERIFGSTILNSDGKAVPVRYIGEQHVREDLGRIPSFQEGIQELPTRP
jgi:hypothetical protein